MLEFKNGVLDWDGTKYDIVGYRGDKVVINKTVRYGIYYNEYTIKQITRKVRDGIIRLEGYNFDIGKFL